MIGTELRTLRQSKELTQENVADLCYTTQKRISQIENGRIDPKYSEVELIRNVLMQAKKVASYNTNGFGKSPAKIGR